MGALMVVGMIVSAAASVASAAAQSKAAAYQAKVAQQNSQIAEQKKQMELKAGADQASRFAMQERAQAGSVRAALAAHGVDVNTDSAMGVQAGQAQVSMSDQLAIQNDTNKKAWGEDIAANSFQNQSKLYSMEATDSMVAGGMKAAGSLFSGVSQLDLKYGFFK